MFFDKFLEIAAQLMQSFLTLKCPYFFFFLYMMETPNIKEQLL